MSAAQMCRGHNFMLIFTEMCDIIQYNIQKKEAHDMDKFVKIQESGEMYLETILILTQKKGSVRSLDVAEYMGFSKPSVSRAVGILRRDGYLEMNPDGHLTLTPSGHEIAAAIYERHTVISGFLVKLGVDEETAAADACKMEHDISDSTLEAIKRFMAN